MTGCSAIAAMLVVEWLTTGVLAIVPIALFGLTAMGSAAIGYRVYASIAAGPAQEPARATPAAGAARVGA